MEQLTAWIKHPETLDERQWQEAENLRKRYPYFQLPLMLSLYFVKKTKGADAYAKALSEAAVCITDRKRLHNWMEEVSKTPPVDHGEEKEVGQSPKRTHSFELIDRFLDEYPDLSSAPSKEGVSAENVSVQKPEVPPALSKEITPAEEAPVRKTETEVSPAEPSDRYFTETLAKIYVKQGKYSKALEIIRRLYLRDSGKNTYFADQIRYLEKLQINSRQQKNKTK